MEVLDKIYQYCDNREVTNGIYLDLQKAFDTVNRPLLIEKPATYGVRGIVFNCFTSYISNRKQYTVLLSHESIAESILMEFLRDRYLVPYYF